MATHILCSFCPFWILQRSKILQVPILQVCSLLNLVGCLYGHISGNYWKKHLFDKDVASDSTRIKKKKTAQLAMVKHARVEGCLGAAKK